MLMLILIMLMFSMSLTFILMNHPLSMGLILLIQTTLIAISSGLFSLNYWFSYIIFIIMVGGMLVLFIYMTSIASNEKFNLSYKTLIILYLFFIFSLLFMIFLDYFFINLNFNLLDLNNQNNYPNFKFSLNKFLNWPLMYNFYLLIIYLLITLIMVVKITNINVGPLRQKI